MNNNTLHYIGPWHTMHGSMFNKSNSIMLDEDIAIIIDSCPEDDFSALLKVGTWDKISTHFKEMVDKYNAIGMPETYENMKTIKFNVKFEGIPEQNIPDFAPDGYNFTVDEICTVINWFSNHIGKQMDEFLKLPLDEAKNKIKSLQRIGF